MVCLVTSFLLWGGGTAKAQETTSNVSFAESGDDNSTLTVTVSGTVTDADVAAFESQLNGKSYSKVAFEGGGTVTDAFVTKLNNKTAIEVLDLGGVYVDNLTSATIPTGLNSNWKELTFPKIKSEGDFMELPAGMLSNYQWTQNLSLKIIIPEGYTEIAEKAFQNISKVTSLSLPSTLKTIGKFAFASTGLKDLSLPEGLDKVDDGAFYELKALAIVKLNEKLRYIGAGAFGCSGNIDDLSAQRTITIPETVRFIGPYAFAERKFSDIYFEGKDAPVCPYGPFNYDNGWGTTTKMWGTAFTGSDDKVHWCNGGFDKKSNFTGLADKPVQGYANRENYKNTYYMTVMHYPTDANEPDKYSDQSRKYETIFSQSTDAETGKVTETFDWNKLYTVGQETEQLKYHYDSNSSEIVPTKGYSNEANNQSGTQVEVGYRDSYLGDGYIWPSQTQFLRAYVTAGLGLKWDGVTPVDTKLSPEDEKVLKEAGYDLSDKTLSYNAFCGTRKFALTNADVKSSPKYKIDIKSGEWWTLCVPFNMTKKQVLDTFGAKTKLCLFTSVERKIDVDGKNHILLSFTQDVLNYSTTKDGVKAKGDDGRWNYDYIKDLDETDDDEIVIWAHESYMIKPDGGENSDKDAVFVVENYDPIEGNPLPSVVDAVTTSDLQQDADYTKEYRFVGNYLGGDDSDGRAVKARIPQYSYIYAATKKDPTVKFRFYTGTKAVWLPNKSLVQTNNRGGGFVDYTSFFGGEKGTTLPTSNAKQTSLFGDEDFGSTTGIDDVTIVAGDEVLSPIYTIEGKLVGTNGNVEGLAKGVYIQAGKKFVVK